MSTVFDLDFDRWREAYDKMDFAAQQEFYRDVARIYPHQRSANIEMIRAAFDMIDAKTVVELGGWDGWLAGQFPDTIWRNYDLVKVPQATSRYGYLMVVLDDYLWNKPPAKADVFVACHTIEHLSTEHFRQLADWLTTRWVYLEAPLEDGPRDWTGYAGSHILDIGWEGVGGIMLANGYKPIAENLWERQPSGVS